MVGDAGNSVGNAGNVGNVPDSYIPALPTLQDCP